MAGSGEESSGSAPDILSRALHGDVNAQFELAREMEQDKQQDLALGWYKKAALQGHRQAAYHVGVICLSGDKTQQKDAIFWLMKAAENGHAAAEYQIGLAHERGIGVTQNPDEGLRWIRLAAKHGEPEARKRIDGMNMWLDEISSGEFYKPRKGSIA